MKVWFDTEFIDTGREVHLLSIGMVREDGLTYYAEPKETDRSLACEWVQKNVLPHMSGPVQTRKSIRDDIVAFCGPRPEFWAYYGAYDWLCLSQLFGRMLDVPADWPNFAFDVQAIRALQGVRELPKQSGTEHNALDDALWTREAWQFLLERERALSARRGILGGDLSLSGSEDMCQAIRDGMLALEVSIRVFESVSPQTRATEESK